MSSITSTQGSPLSPNGSTDDNIIDTTPLLPNHGLSRGENSSGRRSVRRQSLRDAARFLASSRRLMREPSMLVREAAAEQLEERQSDWAYSSPVVILDIIWNLAFVIVSGTVLFLSRSEQPKMPLRLWIMGYAFQCVLHMVCVYVEYQRRRRSVEGVIRIGGDEGEYVSLTYLNDEGTSSVAKHLESANTMFSFIWWIIGFYWITMGNQELAHSSPQLYWLCVIFLGFDVFFVVFCVALACVIGIAVCCCLPCIIAILYAVADQEGASKEDIDQLPKYNFRKADDSAKLKEGVEGPLAGVMIECGTDSPIEHAIPQENAECCICLSPYDDGVELRELPCGHHFHSSCVDKWLHINAICPLCKYNILKSTAGREEV